MILPTDEELDILIKIPEVDGIRSMDLYEANAHTGPSAFRYHLMKLDESGYIVVHGTIKPKGRKVDLTFLGRQLLNLLREYKKVK